MNVSKPLPSVQQIQALFDYDPEAGHFRHKGANSIIKGRCNGATYVFLYFPGMGDYAASRVAWKLMTGADPRGMIDHINGIRDDNRFANLRDVPAQINAANNHGNLWQRVVFERRESARGARDERRIKRRMESAGFYGAVLSLPG